MSTVAFKDGIMAADTQLSDGNMQLYVPKIFNVNNQHLLGLVGDWAGCLRFQRWFVETNYPKYVVPKPDFSDSMKFDALIVNRAGHIIMTDQDMEQYIIAEKYWAAGSGRDIAIGAMAQGASAIEAVEIAIKYNVYTGGEVMSLKFDV